MFTLPPCMDRRLSNTVLGLISLTRSATSYKKHLKGGESQAGMYELSTPPSVFFGRDFNVHEAKYGFTMFVSCSAIFDTKRGHPYLFLLLIITIVEDDRHHWSLLRQFLPTVRV